MTAPTIAPWDTMPWGAIWGGTPVTGMPALTVEIDWTSSPLSVPSNWTDVTSRVRGFSFDYGRQRELDRTEVGSGTILFKNLDRALDPSHTGSPYYPNVVPMRHVRIRAAHDTNAYDVARGFIRSFPQTWPGKVGAEVAVEFEDAFSVLARMDLTAYSNEVLADQPVGYWRLRETTGTTALDEGGNSAGPFNGAYTGSFTLNQAGPLYGGSGAAWLTNASNGNVIIGNVAALNLAGDLTIEFWWRPSAASELGQETLLGSSATAPAPYEVTTTALGVGNGARPGYSGWDQSGQLALSYPLGWTNGILPANVWGHVAITRQAGQITFYVNGTAYPAVRSHQSAIQPSASVNVRIGWNVRDSGAILDGRMAHVALYDHALPPDRIAAHYAARFDTFVSQRTDLAIGAILDAARWPATLRDLHAGRSTLTENTPDGPVLDWLLKAAELSEGGILYAAPDGRITFRERLDAVTSQATYGDGAGELGMQELSLGNVDDWLRTVVRAEAAGMTPQQVEDTVASEKYGRRWLPISDLLLKASDVWDRINGLLQRFSTPRERPESLTVRLGAPSPDAAWAQALGRQLMDMITVKRRPPGPAGYPGYGQGYDNSAITLPSRIIGISHDVSPAVWQTTFNLMSAQDTVATDFWVLGTAGASEVGTTSRLGY